ncbi:MAG: single-stranded DNA-binding protein [Gemmataceae bacterium]|jgi:single-strand DNA-binding protein|nr:single-stranded DNA-binding protein [Gemmataceae bacterium]
MASLNKVMLIGRLIDNPEEPRVLPNSGNKVIKFRFAVGRSRKNPQTNQWENDPNPLYIDCEAYSRGEITRLVDVIANYCRKGSQIYLEGELRLDTWSDKTTGEKRSKHKIVVSNIELLDKAPSAGGHEEGLPTQSGGYSSGGSSGRTAHPPAHSGGGYSDDYAGGSGDDIPF